VILPESESSTVIDFFAACAQAININGNHDVLKDEISNMVEAGAS
jgi:hypothetical protein